MKTEYLSCADTAKLIRSALKRSFPSTKFSVKSHVYSGGASINIAWLDGPTDKIVATVTGPFAGGRFDSSIDMATTHDSWLLPDGTACVASDPGTTGSMGSRSPIREWMPVPGCRLVSFGSKYVFTDRSLSPAFAERVLAKVRDKWGTVDLSVHVSRDGTACLTGNYDDERKAREISNRLVILQAA